MDFDLRLPIGGLFVLFGVILTGDGLFAHRLVLGINVNLWWGLVMLLFGALMLGSRSLEKGRARAAARGWPAASSSLTRL